MLFLQIERAAPEYWASLAQKLVTIFERVGGIEPPSLAWKAKVIPLYNTRDCGVLFYRTASLRFFPARNLGTFTAAI